MDITLDPRCTSCGAPLDYLPDARVYPHLCTACREAMTRAFFPSSGMAVMLALRDSWPERAAQHMRNAGDVVESARLLLDGIARLQEEGFTDSVMAEKLFIEAIVPATRQLSRAINCLQNGNRNGAPSD